MKIVLDCDDVLSNAREPFAEVVSHLVERTVSHEEWDKWDALIHQNDLTFEQLTPRVVETNVLENMDPEKGAAVVTNMLKKLGYEIIILTARGFHPNGHKITENWCNVHNITFDEIIVVGPHECKSETIKGLGDIHIYVDDNGSHIAAADQLDNVEHAIIMNMPWNQHDDHDHRIDKLSQILELI